MSPQLIVTIINIVLLSLVVIGFLIGLKGVKKSLWGLGSFVIGFVLVLIFTPMLSKLLLRININGSSLETTILTTITEALGAEYASNELIKEVISNYPLLIVNIFSYIILMFLLMALIKILSSIVYKIVYSKKNKQVKEECKIINGKPQMVVVKEKEKKHRLLGGLVKAVETLAFLLLLIMPINGLIKTFNEIVGTTPVSAETTTNDSISDTIKQNIPNEVLDILACYQDSVFFKISDVANLNTAMLNQVASVKVNGQVVKLGDELNALVVIYDDYNYAMSLDFSNTESLKDIDFNRVRNFIKTVGNMGTFKALFEDSIKMALDEWQVEVGTVEYVAKQSALDVLDNYSLKNFADDMVSVVDIAEIAVNGGLVDEFLKEKIDIDSILEKLYKDDEKLSKQLVDSIFKINLLNKGIVSFSNVAIYELEKELRTTEGLEDISLPRIIVKNAKIESSEINLILSNFYNAYKELSKLNITDSVTLETTNFLSLIEQDPMSLLVKASTDNNNYSVEKVVHYVGNIYDAIFSINYLNSNGTLTALFDALDNYEETSKFVNFSTLKNSMKSDFANLAKAVQVLVDSDLIDLIVTIEVTGPDGESEMIGSETLSITTVLENLSKISDSGVSYSKILLDSILNIKCIKPAISYAFEDLTSKINKMFVEIGEEICRDYEVVTKFNTSAILSNDQAVKNAEIEKFVNILNGLATLAKEGLFDANNFAGILNILNLQVVGEVLQNVKTLTLLSDNSAEEKGVYKTYIEEYLMKTGLKNYINFEPTIKDNYSWYEELRDLTAEEKASGKHNANSFITYVKEIKVNDAEKNQITLLEFLFDANSDYNTLISQLSTEQLNEIVDNVFDVEILKPISVMLTNLINESIKSIVLSTLPDTVIPDIDEIPEAQVEDVKKVITAVAEILDDVKAENGNVDFTTVDISNIGTQTLTDIIVALDNNAQKEDGVLKDTYDTVKNYLKTKLDKLTTEDGKTLEQIITESETSETNIDWKTIAPDLIDKYKKSLS